MAQGAEAGWDWGREDVSGGCAWSVLDPTQSTRTGLGGLIAFTENSRPVTLATPFQYLQMMYGSLKERNVGKEPSGSSRNMRGKDEFILLGKDSGIHA